MAALGPWLAVGLTASAPCHVGPSIWKLASPKLAREKVHSQEGRYNLM